MKNAVRWYKCHVEDTAKVQVFENGKWLPARNSAAYKPDINYENASEGFATFQNALRLGYENKGLFISDVEKHD